MGMLRRHGHNIDSEVVTKLEDVTPTAEPEQEPEETTTKRGRPKKNT